MEIDNFFPECFTYMNIRVYDVEATDLLSHWNNTYMFINEARCSTHTHSHTLAYSLFWFMVGMHFVFSMFRPPTLIILLKSFSLYLDTHDMCSVVFLTPCENDYSLSLCAHLSHANIYVIVSYWWWYRKSGQAVLVHCKMGVSRSASTVIAFLMKQQGWTLDEALNHVRERRPIVQPNEGFLKQLHTYSGILSARWLVLS